MRNHYIQKKFIENFCGKNGILIYDIINDKFLPKHNKANNIALENDLYHLESINYPDEQIEKDLKKIEDAGIDIIREIEKTEFLPSSEDLAKLISYLYYQSLRTPSQIRMFQEEIRKLNKICKTTDFNDMPLYRFYNEKVSINSINQLLNENDIYLLKQDEPIFFITDCFCSALQSRLDRIIPITSNFALYLTPKNRKQLFNLSLKENVANIISFEISFILMIYSNCNYRQFAFASYTDSNYKLIPAIYKYLHKKCNGSI